MLENIVRGLIGVVVLIGLCYLFSNKRKSIDWGIVAGGIGLQVILAVLVLATPFSVVAGWVSGLVVEVLGYSDVGAEFMFGELVDASRYGFAFRVLPIILLVSALTSLLYYLGVLQWVVFGFAYSWVIGVSVNK